MKLINEIINKRPYSFDSFFKSKTIKMFLKRKKFHFKDIIQIQENISFMN